MAENKKLEDPRAITARRVRAALCGRLALSALSDDEGALFNAAIAGAVRNRLAEGHYGEVLAARGMTSIALADDGRLVEYWPNGTTQPSSIR
jgi:hypothetical protein